jgi:hypothetical protein
MIRVGGKSAMPIDSQIHVAWQAQDVHLFSPDGHRRVMS